MKVKRVSDNSYRVKCPSCGNHIYDGRWKFNGDFDKPTFRDSMRVELKDADGNLIEHCHSYVTDGMIEFLPDNNHQWSGMVLPLEDIE